ncbi:MAG: hypothetical protein ABIF85_02555 [Nanoarchaeota archaeon]|nr:hypothetical protein [Nanoarchaeota archaeon]MBU4299677.1 hypothetical protein [Nanoarchaeota archaeon]MBU4451514.1 hypothetical protein [Nanoarchaeota archaeon]MCG2723964.1 hypothetical protein [archaeon]
MFQKKSKNIFVSIMSILFFLVLQSPPASAAEFVIGLSDLTTNPSTIYAGSGITIKADYSVSSTSSAKVRLELLFDGNVVDSITEYRSTGNYNIEFTYTPSSSTTGGRNIGIRARIYDGTILRDEDLVTKTININALGNDHGLEISSITSKKLTSPSERFPVDVEVRNTGDSIEYITISAKIGSRTYTNPTFSIYPGKSEKKTIYVSAPDQSGTYELLVRAYNTDISVTGKTSIEVQTTSISLTLKKTSANAGEWIDIYGYATRGLYASESVVSLYLDNTYSGTLQTRENGYYSTKIKFDNPGSHRITVMSGSLTTSQIVYVNAQQTYPGTPAAQPEPRQIVIPAGNYSAIIIITGESQYVVYPEAPKEPEAPINASKIIEPKKDKYENTSFVNIDISANELDAVQNSGNLLKITITNHLGRREEFSISTDFDKAWTYLPGTDVILNGDSKIFEAYFTPDKTGTFPGNVFVFEKDRIIKTIPISLFVAPRVDGEIKEPGAIGFSLNMQSIVMLSAALIFVIFALGYAGLKKHKALEPKIIPPSQDVSEILRAMASPFSEKIKKTDGEEQKKEEKDNNGTHIKETKNDKPANNGNIFFVPREKVIM